MIRIIKKILLNFKKLWNSLSVNKNYHKTKKNNL